MHPTPRNVVPLGNQLWSTLTPSEGSQGSQVDPPELLAAAICDPVTKPGSLKNKGPGWDVQDEFGFSFLPVFLFELSFFHHHCYFETSQKNGAHQIVDHTRYIFQHPKKTPTLIGIRFFLDIARYGARIHISMNSKTCCDINFGRAPFL